jgi:hypothetical protein
MDTIAAAVLGWRAFSTARAQPREAGREADMSDRRILTDQEAYELLAFMISCAENGTHEPHRYGPRRLVDAASLLLAGMIDASSGAEREWLEGYRRELDAKKIWATRDWDSFGGFIRDAAADLAREFKRREHALSETAPITSESGDDRE